MKKCVLEELRYSALKSNRFGGGEALSKPPVEYWTQRPMEAAWTPRGKQSTIS